MFSRSISLPNTNKLSCWVSGQVYSEAGDELAPRCLCWRTLCWYTSAGKKLFFPQRWCTGLCVWGDADVQGRQNWWKTMEVEARYCNTIHTAIKQQREKTLLVKPEPFLWWVYWIVMYVETDRWCIESKYLRTIQSQGFSKYISSGPRMVKWNISLFFCC